jgi:hypothetical protein
LNGFTEILSHTFSLNDVLVDLAGCDVVVSGECGKKISFIVAEIKVHFLYSDEIHAVRIISLRDTYTTI